MSVYARAFGSTWLLAASSIGADQAPAPPVKAGQELLVNKPPAVGESVSSVGLALIGSRVAAITSTATLQERREDGTLRYSLATQVTPPAQVVVDAHGDIVSMTMDIIMFKLRIERSAGPVPLLGAELSPTGLVASAGPAPRAQPVNRYRLGEAAAALPNDGFQRVAENLVKQNGGGPFGEDDVGRPLGNRDRAVARRRGGREHELELLRRRLGVGSVECHRPLLVSVPRRRREGALERDEPAAREGGRQS